MLLLALAAALQLASPRPEAIVPRGEEAAYAAFLRAQALASQDYWTGARCEAATLTEVSSRYMAGGEVPVLREQVRLEGCGRTTLLNIDVARFGGAPAWRIRDGAPGQTRTDRDRQDSFLDSLIGRAGAGLQNGCTPALIEDTYVAANPGGIDFGGGDAPTASDGGPRFGIDLGGNLPPQSDAAKAWAEIWRLSICGEDRTTLVLFIPETDGEVNLMFFPIWREVGGDPDNLPPRVAPAPWG